MSGGSYQAVLRASLAECSVRTTISYVPVSGGTIDPIQRIANRLGMNRSGSGPSTPKWKLTCGSICS